MTPLLVAGKDLRIEARSRVALSQVAPFGVVALVLFAFALGPDRALMAKGAPGLFWVAVLFCTVLAVQRSVSVESADGARDGLRLSGLDPAGLFLGQGRGGGRPAGRARGGARRSAWCCSTGPAIEVPWLIVVSCAARRRSGWPRPAPSTAPCRPGCGSARRCCPSCSCPSSPRSCWPAPGSGRRRLAGGVAADGTPWLRLLVVFDAVYLALGVVVFGPSRSRHELRTADRRRPGRSPSVRAAWPAGSSASPPLVGTAATVWLGLWVTPPDQVQGDLVRLVYIHPGVAWVALYLAFGLAAVSSLLYLWPRTRSLFWDRLAAAAVEVGVVFNVCTLISGSIWGKPTWGVWWAWDARLTSTAVLLVLFLGYLALRRVPAEPEVRARRSAFVALFAAVDIPIVHFSVLWWRTLHQGATVLNANLSPTIHGSMAWTLLLGFVAADPGLRLDAAGPLPDRRARGLAGRSRTRRGPARASAEGDSEGGEAGGADGGVGAAADERTLAALGHPGEEPVAVDAASGSSLPEGVR